MKDARLWIHITQTAFYKHRSIYLGALASVVLGALVWNAAQWALKWTNPSSASERIDLLSGIAQFLGGAALLWGVWHAYQGLQSSRKTLEHTIESQYSDRFHRAVEQLCSSEEGRRTGAIYALESLAAQSDTHYQQSMDVLMHFVRGNSSYANARYLPKGVDFESPITRADVQVAIAAVGRRRSSPFSQTRNPLDFSRLALSGYSFLGGWMDHCNFFKSELNYADFSGASLNGATFDSSMCQHAQFDGAGLSNATFFLTDLSYASFFNPTIESENSTSPHDGRLRLSRANLNFLNLQPNAELKASIGKEGARMRGTEFLRSITNETTFCHANLVDAMYLREEQMVVAWWDDTTRFPDHLESARRKMGEERILRRKASRAYWDVDDQNS